MGIEGASRLVSLGIVVEVDAEDTEHASGSVDQVTKIFAWRFRVVCK
jgi:hypothetical protein